MNFYEEMIENLKQHGMFPNQATEVMDKYMEQDELMQGRWFESVHSYPENMLPIVWMSVKDFAYKWIVENCPNAWFRPMFQYSNEELKQKIAEKRSN